MEEYINKLKEIETKIELLIGKQMTEDKATDIYSITNELMCKIKKEIIPNLSLCGACQEETPIIIDKYCISCGDIICYGKR